MDDERTIGERTFDAVYGGTVPLPDRAARGPYVDHVIDHVFGKVWADGRLSVRDRRLLILGIAAAGGNQDILEIQLKAALARGELADEDLDGLLIFLSHYIGLPLTGPVQRAVAAARAAVQAQSAD